MSLPPSEIPSGAMRFNSDSQKLEYYDGSQWVQVNTFSPNLNGGARGITGGALDSSATNTINYVTISSTGNAVDFGDTTFTAAERREGCASSTRGIFCGGFSSPAAYNNIEYITISSTGNTQDFGDLSTTSKAGATCSNSTRGIHYICQQYPATVNTIDYFTISSTGNTADFGDVTSGRYFESTATANTTRGLFFGGYSPSPAGVVNSIDYITLSTLGNTQDFGDVSNAVSAGGNDAATSFANSTRAIVGAFYLAYTRVEYVQIQTLGNAVKFGDLIDSKFFRASMNSSTRGIFAGGRSGTNAMEYVTIQTQGNAVDFGDLTQSLSYQAGFSNAHGGL